MDLRVLSLYILVLDKFYISLAIPYYRYNAPGYYYLNYNNFLIFLPFSLIILLDPVKVETSHKSIVSIVSDLDFQTAPNCVNDLDFQTAPYSV